MKKNIVIAMSAVLLLGSCDSYTGAGAYMGSSLGSVLGSAIGGIAGGPRGSDIGTLVGAATGAVVGAAVGDAADQNARQQQHEYLSQRNQRIQASKQRRNYSHTECDDTYNIPMQPRMSAPEKRVYEQPQSSNDNEGGYQIDPSQMIDESNSGDDRIDFDTDNDDSATQQPVSDGADESSTLMQQSVSSSADNAAPQQKLELRNVVFSDDSHDGVLCGDETGTVVFELFNRSSAMVTDVVPTVQAEKGTGNISISPSIRVESIAPGHGIRYTATVKAGRKIKDGSVKLYVSAMRNGRPLSYTTVVDVPTRRR